MSLMMFLCIASIESVMPTVYWACGGTGVALLLISMLGAHNSNADFDVDAGAAGGLDVDVHVDVDADIGGAVDAHGADLGGHHDDGVFGDATSISTWFSMRFLVFFVAIFGLIGLVMTYMTQVGPNGSLGIALACGLVGGQGVHQTFRRIMKTSGNSAASIGDYMEKVGRVTIPIDPPQKGEITIDVRGGQQYIPAVSKHADTRFSVGDEVVVVEYNGNAATVISRKEFDFRRDA